MELMLLVYLVNTVTVLGSGGFGFILFIGLVLFALGFFTTLDDNIWHNTEEGQNSKEVVRSYSKRGVKWVLVMMVVCFLTPNKDTAIMMAGAYLVQEVVTSEEVKEISGMASVAIKSQLSSWAKEAPELKDMLIESGIQEADSLVNKAKETVVQEAK